MSCQQYGGMNHGWVPPDPFRMVCITSALSIRTLSRSGAVGQAYCATLYRLQRRLASSAHRLFSAVWPAFSHSVARRHTNLVVCWYTSPAASATKVTLYMCFVIRHIHGLSEAVATNEHTRNISAVILARLFLEFEEMPASSACIIPQIGFGSATLSRGSSRPSPASLAPRSSFLPFVNNTNRTSAAFCRCGSHGGPVCVVCW